LTGVELSYSVEGPALADEPGRAVVYLASLGRPVRDLDLLSVTAKSHGWTSVKVELPGVAPSPLPLAGCDLHAIAAAVAGVIENAAGKEAGAVVVGHAFGNRVARCVAADRPDLVRGLVLLGCGGRFPGDDEARAALRRCFDVTASSEEHLRDVATAFFAPGNDPAVWNDGWHPEAADAQAAAVAATPTEDWWLPPEPIRVLALVGAEDRIAPPANAAALVDALGERGRLVVLHGAGHALVPEQGPRVAAEFAEFLADRR
jgi:pimeloyl-ACP methyl ester carboxylesterase